MNPASPQCPLDSPSNNPIGELSERSARRAFQTTFLARLPKPFYMLLMGTDKPKGRVQAANSATHIAMAP